MSKLYLSHQSALEYWDQAALLGQQAHVLQRPASWSELPDAMSRESEIRSSGALSGISVSYPCLPLHMLVGACSQRHSNFRLVHHLWKGSLPAGSLCYFETKPHIIVSSPEFAFLQLATELGFIDLAQLGMEICGRFTTGSNGRIVERPPLATHERIASFLDGVGSARGAERAKSVAKWLLDGAASPMEAVTYLLLCLPPRYGGYGLPKPELNKSKAIPQRLWRFTDKRSLITDLYWDEQSLDIEYDSDEEHTGGLKASDDSLRRVLLEEMGNRVVSVNKALEDGARGFDQIAHVVAKATKFRIHKPSQQQLLARSHLREQLLDRGRNWKYHTRFPNDAQGTR